MSCNPSKYFHTVRYLRSVQLVGQFIKPFVLRAKPSVTAFSGFVNPSIKTLIPALDLDEDYLSRFDLNELMHGDVTLLGERRHVDFDTWKVDASPLWRFNLHYFEYAIALAVEFRRSGDIRYYEKFRELLRSWMAANSIGNGDGWHPYTISRRISNLFICFELFGKTIKQDTSFKHEAMQSIYAQYRTLLKRRELWQLGNHYFENLKTIVFGSLMFGENAMFRKYIRRFLDEVNEEVLPDGVHFELSIMYHKIIMEDILRVTFWLRQAGKTEYQELLPVLQRMTDALVSLEKDMGKTPLFNDAGEEVAKEATTLLRAAEELFDIRPQLTDTFPSSGYCKLYDDDTALMLDVGEIGPRYMPGHGHCDCLSFELSVGGKPLFVNSGTYQYQGELRSYFRSTKAHNTLLIGNREQSECWSEHRVARRISNVRFKKNGQLITGSYRSYQGDVHTRMLSLADGALSVLDSVSTDASDTVHSFLHIAPRYTVTSAESCVEVVAYTDMVCKIYPVECVFQIHTSGKMTNYAPSFGVLQQATTIEFYWQSDTNQHGYVVDFHHKKEE